MQRTFIILKPDCLEKGHAGTVIQRFEAAGYRAVGCKMMQLTPALLREHYAHVTHFPFYPRLEMFMESRPVIVMVWEGENVIAGVRAMLGPTDSTKAPKGTIRGDFGTNSMFNVVHASDGEDSAKAEIARFFKPEEVYSFESCYF